MVHRDDADPSSGSLGCRAERLVPRPDGDDAPVHLVSCPIARAADAGPDAFEQPQEEGVIEVGIVERELRTGPSPPAPPSPGPSRPAVGALTHARNARRSDPTNTSTRTYTSISANHGVERLLQAVGGIGHLAGEEAGIVVAGRPQAVGKRLVSPGFPRELVGAGEGDAVRAVTGRRGAGTAPGSARSRQPRGARPPSPGPSGRLLGLDRVAAELVAQRGSTFAPYESSWRERKRVSRESVMTGAGTSRSIASWIVQRPSPESATQPLRSSRSWPWP